VNLHIRAMDIRAITLDLDDTLWPFAPVGKQIEAALRAFLEEHAPRTAARYDHTAAMEAMAAVKAERDDLAQDLGALRRLVMRKMLSDVDEDPDLADPAFDVVFAARQEVTLYPEAAEALDRMAARVPLLALTNGNADLQLTGVARWFSAGCVSAEDIGVGKPHPRVFEIACERLAQAPADVLHAGDHPEHDVAGALDFGMQAVWVHRDFDGDVPAGAERAADLTALADLVEQLT
jgi:putative hydrolase of the HAD superfamily